MCIYDIKVACKRALQSFVNNLPPSVKYLPTRLPQVQKFYKDAQWWSEKEIADWQLQRLKQIVEFAYENTDGYHQLYDEAKIKPQNIRSLEDINEIPFTTKELLRDNIEKFTYQGGNSRKLYKTMTGGSTGIPFSFYVDKKNSMAEYGFMYTAWESIGWNKNDVGIKLRGAHLGDPDHLIKKIGYHEYALSSSFMTDENYEKYMSIIESTRATYLHVYPSTLSDLSQLIINNHDEGRLGIKQIFLGSENLYSWQKDLIKNAFPHSRLMSWYGHSERAIWAPWCEYEERYHLNPFYGYTEILKGDKEVNEGEVGELVGTSFWMYGTPFIRYRTNDYAEKGPNCCERCGRNMQLLNMVEGRSSEIIVGRSGRRISLTVFAGSIMHGKTFDHIRQFRFIQYKEGELKLAIIPSNNFNSEDEGHLKESVSKFLGEDFDFEVIKVKELSRTKSGKFTYLEQHLNIERSDLIVY